MKRVSRRKLLAGGGAAAASLPVAHALIPHRGLHGHEAAAAAPGMAGAHSGGAAHRGAVGRVDPSVNGFDPARIVRDFDYGRTRREGGRLVREWNVVAQDKEIEVAPGVKFAAWTYNGRVPGPTLRGREGERLRVNFLNGSSHPHTMHFHGIHRDVHDGIPGVGPGNIEPGG